MQDKLTAKELLELAKKHEVCSLLKGNESERELLELFQTPQGIEFCAEHDFPTLDQIRGFKGELAEMCGVYIDCGTIIKSNHSSIVLIGATTAELTYSDPLKRHNVVLLHGAEARVTAGNHAVVFVENISGRVTQMTTTTGAKIL